MAFYYVNINEQSTGEHEVHQDGCKHLPEYENRKILGSFSNCSEALKEAKKHYSNVDGCFYCCTECHKK